RASDLRSIGVTKLQDLRDSLEQFKDAIPEYVDRCVRDGVWPPTPPGPVPRGISIFHLVAILHSLRGKEALLKFWASFGQMGDLDSQSHTEEIQDGIAKEAAAKPSLG